MGRKASHYYLMRKPNFVGGMRWRVRFPLGLRRKDKSWEIDSYEILKLCLVCHLDDEVKPVSALHSEIWYGEAIVVPCTHPEKVLRVSFRQWRDSIRVLQLHLFEHDSVRTLITLPMRCLRTLTGAVIASFGRPFCERKCKSSKFNQSPWRTSSTYGDVSSGISAKT